MTKSWHNEPWRPHLDWQCPAGILLKECIAALDKGVPFTITVFGSSPLQMGLHKGFLSADIDIFGDEQESSELRQAGLLKGQRELYVEPCPASVFRSAPDWPNRAYIEKCGNAHVVFPHPIDILISKISRLEKKDLDAFLLVKKITGHPTAEELKESLQRAVDIYRPAFDEEVAYDPISNTCIVWDSLYGKAIDVRKDIIAPALAVRRKTYHPESAERAVEHLKKIASLAPEDRSRKLKK